MLVCCSTHNTSSLSSCITQSTDISFCREWKDPTNKNTVGLNQKHWKEMLAASWRTIYQFLQLLCLPLTRLAWKLPVQWSEEKQEDKNIWIMRPLCAAKKRGITNQPTDDCRNHSRGMDVRKVFQNYSSNSTKLARYPHVCPMPTWVLRSSERGKWKKRNTPLVARMNKKLQLPRLN